MYCICAIFRLIPVSVRDGDLAQSHVMLQAKKSNHCSQTIMFSRCPTEDSDVSENSLSHSAWLTRTGNSAEQTSG